MNHPDVPQTYPSPIAAAADGSSGNIPYSYNTTDAPQQAGYGNGNALAQSPGSQHVIDALGGESQRAPNTIQRPGPPGGMIGSHNGLQPNIQYRQQEHQDHAAHSLHSQIGQAQAGQMGGFDNSNGSTAPRKRSKTSRACDECRRKKIRCDSSELNHEPPLCTNCKRLSVFCMFSREPQKRGPSKGYIKDLADRISFLETKPNAPVAGGNAPPPPNQYMQQDSPQQHGERMDHRVSHDFSPSGNQEHGSRKRSFSQVSPEYSSYPGTGNWSGLQAEPLRDMDNQAVNGRGPLAQPPSARWDAAPDVPQHDSFESIERDSQDLELPIDLDVKVLESYYQYIDPTFPILSKNPQGLKAMLNEVPVSISNAFGIALAAAVSSFSRLAGPSAEHRDVEKKHMLSAANALMSAQMDGNIANSVQGLVCLQAVLLLAIEADSHCEASGAHSMWLGIAISMAYSMKLHVHKPTDLDLTTDGGIEKIEAIRRRLWISIAIMDRWHSSSNNSPLLVPESSVVLHPIDETLLGAELYQIARLSIVIGHFSTASLESAGEHSSAIPVVSMVTTLLRGELERCRESIPQQLWSSPDNPLMILSYCHIRILAELTLPEVDPHELVSPATTIVKLLAEYPDFISPLAHHSKATATMTLLEMTKSPLVKVEAENFLKIIQESPTARTSRDAWILDMISPNRFSGESADNQRLQKLATLATNVTRANGDSTEVAKLEPEAANATPIAASSSSPWPLSFSTGPLKSLLKVSFWGGK